MKKLFVSEHWFSIQQVAQILEANRIPYMVKNEFASGAMGELAPQDVIPEVWLMDDDWFAKAQALIEDLHHLVTDEPSWTCPTCGEENEGSFELCWQCGWEPTELVS